MKLKVGIFFGGPSREREISFAGGRTVYDNLNKNIFEPIPIFVDSFRNWVLLDWQYVYKGTIRDFFPPVDTLPPSLNDFQIYAESIASEDESQQQALLSRIGQPLSQEAAAGMIDVAFLALHGEYGEDGQLQQILTNLGIPYTGSGIEASKIGMDKAWQKELMAAKDFACPKVEVIKKEAWQAADVEALYAEASKTIGFPLVIRPANQGSSIGVSIIGSERGVEGFQEAVNLAFFQQLLSLEDWQTKSPEDKIQYVRSLGDIRDGLGFPLHVTLEGTTTTFYHPEALLTYLNNAVTQAEFLSQFITFAGDQSEERVILEAFIDGKEFSCIVVRTEDGGAIALPPTEIVKGGEVFDYRAKYMPGLSRKETPIKLPDTAIAAIRQECKRLFVDLGFQVYARIDGFYTPEGQIFLNDPNTTSGMLPSSFFFHQAAEIGLNPSQFLTYILRISLQERVAEQPGNKVWEQLLLLLDDQIAKLQTADQDTRSIGVILGGYSFERHISVESGRNIFEKLASSINYEPQPIFLSGSDEQHELYQLPINLLLKDNADDIRDKIKTWAPHPVLTAIRKECQSITDKYASANVVFAPQVLNYDQLAKQVDGVFIALHGRPGEDGQVQRELDARGVAYNGSGETSSSITIDKYRTLQTLAKHNLPTAGQLVMTKQDFTIDPTGFINRIEASFAYPFIAKPVDDGCSSAVKVIRNREQLKAYSQLLFNQLDGQESLQRELLKLDDKEEFSRKSEVLIEELVTKGEGVHFLEITGGLLTTYDEQGKVVYEVFEPSEALASGEVLSLQEKFLAGEGQNLTPARLGVGDYSYEHILSQVRETLERAARLLQVEGYCRTDAFVRVLADGKVETQIIEVNSLPGMTPATAIFHQAALAGYQPAEFIHRILDFGFARVAQGAIATTEEPTKEIETTKNIPLEIVEPTNEVEEPAPMVEPTLITKEETPVVAAISPITEPAPAASTGQGEEGWFKNILSLLRTSYLWKNIGAMLAFLALAFFALNIFLNVYTGHGDSVQVENYEGLSLEEATQKARSQGFNASVNEAPFTRKIAQGDVIDQEPDALERIKSNRTIYLTVIGAPREVPIPAFRDAADDFEQYKPRLESLEISSVVKEKVFDAKLAPNTILHFNYRGKQYMPTDVNRGVKILQGSTLEFTVTTDKDKYVQLPALMCRSYSEVQFLLRSLDLKVGEVTGVTSGQGGAYIAQQSPVYRPGKRILRESTIDLVLSRSLPSGCIDDEPTPEEGTDNADQDSEGEQ